MADGNTEHKAPWALGQICQRLSLEMKNLF
jgi:hypothetical protein